MIVSCPNCSTRFTIPGAAIPVTGRAVRCSKCGTKWRQGQPSDEVSGLTTAAESTPEIEEASESELEAAEPETTETAEAPEADTPPWSADTSPEEDAEPEESETSEAAGPSLLDIDVSADESAEGEQEEKTALDLTAKRDEDTPRPSALKKKPAEPEKETPSLMIGWIVLAVLVVLVIGGTFAFKDQIVSGWPATARLYSALGLHVTTHAPPPAAEAEKPAAAKEKPQFQTESVTTSTETVDGVDYRVVNGTVVNSGKVAAPVPDIRTRLSGEDRKVLSEAVHKLPAKTLAPGETMTFTVRIAKPPADARYLEVDTVSADSK